MDRIQASPGFPAGAVAPPPRAASPVTWPFASSERGGQAAAILLSLIETARLNGVEPYAYLKDVLTNQVRRFMGAMSDSVLVPYWRRGQCAAFPTARRRGDDVVIADAHEATARIEEQRLLGHLNEKQRCTLGQRLVHGIGGQRGRRSPSPFRLAGDEAH